MLFRGVNVATSKAGGGKSNDPWTNSSSVAVPSPSELGRRASPGRHGNPDAAHGPQIVVLRHEGLNVVPKLVGQIKHIFAPSQHFALKPFRRNELIFRENSLNWNQRAIAPGVHAVTAE